METESEDTQEKLEQESELPEISSAKADDVTQGKRGSKFILYTALFMAVLVAVMPLIGEVGSTNPKSAGTIGLWIAFFGEFHPVFLHLPIGALMLVVLMEVLGLFSRKNRVNMTVALAFCAACSVLATICGYFLYLGGEYQNELMEEHKRDGIIFTILLIFTFLLRYWIQYSTKMWMKLSYPMMLFLSVGMMISAGHHGGEVTHGDPLDSLPRKVMEKRDAKIKKTAKANSDQGVINSTNDKAEMVVSDLVVYTEIVHPIIEEKCVSCHGPKKVKGGLKMDSIANMLEGGDAEDCLVKGDVKASYMITSMELPLDDEYRMPPEGKPQITADELKVLKWWVEIGAPETEKLNEVKASEEVLQSIKASLRDAN